MAKTRLVIGLGNPGAEYENTYHNAGAQMVNALAAAPEEAEAAPKELHEKLFSYVRAGGLILAKPLTFMNESGAAVRAAVRKFNVRPDDIVLLHDDSDLPLGTWKISRGRGAAGHHGVESVIAALGTNNFTRVRIGIRPANERVRSKATAFVLKPVTKSSAVLFKKTFAEIADALKKDLPQ